MCVCGGAGGGGGYMEQRGRRGPAEGLEHALLDVDEVPLQRGRQRRRVLHARLDDLPAQHRLRAAVLSALWHRGRAAEPYREGLHRAHPVRMPTGRPDCVCLTSRRNHRRTAQDEPLPPSLWRCRVVHCMLAHGHGTQRRSLQRMAQRLQRRSLRCNGRRSVCNGYKPSGSRRP